MSPERASFGRFLRNWVAETERLVPDVSPDAGAERLLRARLELARSTGKRRNFSRVGGAVLVAALGIVAVALVLPRTGASHTFTVDSRPAVSGARVAAAADPRVVEFSEGSIVTVDAQSSLSIQEVKANGAVLELERGEVEVDIVPRRGASWTISAGPFEVHVLGTAFHVEWLPESQHFAVSVVRGAVQVDGPMLEQRRTLSAGAKCVVDWRSNRISIEKVDADAGAATSPAPDLPALPDATSAPGATPLETATPGSRLSLRQRPDGRKVGGDSGKSLPPAESWRDLERAGHFQAAIVEAERVGVDVIYDVSDAGGLMSLARAARFVGRADISSGSLLSCRRRFPGTASAAMAAYLLGRVAQPAEAVGWFSTYLKEQPSGTWAREASGRLIEAYHASGAAKAERDEAKRYLERYPGGPHAEFARRALVE